MPVTVDVDYEIFHTRSRLEKSLNTLKGILQGISIDGDINDSEIGELINWCSLQAEFRENHPYSELLPLIDDALSDGNISSEERSDIIWVCNNFISENKYFDCITASIQQLHGLAHGILADNKIEDSEVMRLLKWTDVNEFLCGTYPFDELSSLLTVICEDHYISDRERLQLKAFLGDFIDTRNSYNIDLRELEKLRSEMHITGICAMCPDIRLKNRIFCFTGRSSRCSRNDIAKIVSENGGIFTDSITQKTNYLVVGNEGNSCWAFSCYGRKVDQAMEMRRKGLPISIVHENDFWDYIR